MASFRKRNEKWQVQIRRKDAPSINKTFTKLGDARFWARQVEIDLENGVYEGILKASDTTLNDLLARYKTDVAPTKKNPSWIVTLSNSLGRELGDYSIKRLTPSVIAKFRDHRLATRAPQTVKHEICFIARVIKVASMEWGLVLPSGNPVDMVAKPKLPRGRDRRLSPEEEPVLLGELTSTPIVRFAVMLAIETAMRRGEILGIKREHIDYRNRTLYIPDTKTGVPRTIPLSTKAAHVLQYAECESEEMLFPIKPRSVSQAFRRACERTDIVNLKFHDMRHEAASRLFEKGLNVMEVASITGHQDLKMLRRYTHLRAEDLAKKLG